MKELLPCGCVQWRQRTQSWSLAGTRAWCAAPPVSEDRAGRSVDAVCGGWHRWSRFRRVFVLIQSQRKCVTLCVTNAQRFVLASSSPLSSSSSSLSSSSFPFIYFPVLRCQLSARTHAFMYCVHLSVCLCARARGYIYVCSHALFFCEFIHFILSL